MAVSLTLGSGGSGGVFAPSLFIGATLGGCLGVVVNGVAYVAAQSRGVQLVDVSDPTMPELIGAIEPGFVLGLDVRLPYAYVANSFAGIVVIDVSNPAVPVEVGLLDTVNARDVEIDPSGDFALVCDATAGFIAVDVTNPGGPFLVSTVAVPDYAREVDVEGSFAYVATEDSGVRVMDISGLPTMSEVGFFDTADEAFGLRVATLLEPVRPSSDPPPSSPR